MRFYLTTPIYYVNSTPHIGHAYTTIAADIVVRHHRQRGDETWFLTGVDEHADKVARVAAEQGLTPREYTDQIVVAWQELPRRVNATNDFFIRTSDEGHKRLRPGLPPADQGQRPRRHLPGRLRRPLLRRLRGVQDRGGARRRQVPRPRHRARVDRGAQLVLPPLRLPGPAARALRRAARLRAAGLPLQRGAQLHRGRAARLLDQPRDADLGGADPVGSGAGRLRLGRRAHQLPERPAATRPARTSSASGRRVHFLAKDILRFHCVYWPALLLAAGYEPPQAAVRARLPEHRPAEDLEVARERDRPARPDRRLRRRRGPVLVRAAGLVRPGRQRHARLVPRALRDASSQTTSATSSRGRRR